MKRNSKTLRTITALAIVAIVFVGFLTNLGIGTISAPGIWDISILCPLGALGTMLASKMMVPRAVVSLVIMVVLIIVFARAFCGWMCPVPLVQKLRGIFTKPEKQTKAEKAKAVKQADDKAAEAAADIVPLTEDEKAALATGCEKDSKGLSGCAGCAKKRGEAVDARHFVLGGALLSTFIFGFPVFCLVCPIGLTFATVLVFWRLFANADMTVAVVLIPLMLIIELVFLRKWCTRFCPMAGLMNLMGRFSRTFKPVIDDAKCLETSKGTACSRCAMVCEADINLRHPDYGERTLADCTRCNACVDACPANAITMPVVAKRGQDVKLAPNER